MQGLLGRFALALASLTVFVLFVEAMLQFVVPTLFRPRFTRLDSELGWHHYPSVSHDESLEGHDYTLSYNAHGFRPPEHTWRKPAGTRRILVLGDSFVDGSEVDDRELFTWHLQECLGDVEVINLGVYGYSTAQELLALERWGLRYEPDLVLLLTVSNDFVGNVQALESFGPAPRFLPAQNGDEGVDPDGLRLEGLDSPAAHLARRATHLPAPGFIRRHSLVYYLVNKHLHQRLGAQRIVETRRARAGEIGVEARFDLYERLVRRINDRAESAGADFAVVFGYLRNELDGNTAAPNRALRQALARDGIPSLDLHTSLRAAERPDASLYYRENIHWNARGHEQVAEWLAAAIEVWQRDGEVPEEFPRRASMCEVAAAY
jgi:lysophospholipase L1-like esterase